MNTPRLHVSPALAADLPVPLDARQVHHLRNVLRKKPGDAVRLFNGRDGEWDAVIDALSAGNGAVRVLACVRPQDAPPCVWLLFAPVKRIPMDHITQKATEMGASRLQPVITQRVNTRRVPLERMRLNAIDAAQQCGLLRVPDIMPPVSLDELAAGWTSLSPPRRLMFCDETAPVSDPIRRLRDAADPADPGQPWAILIGPEGGFDPAEREKLRLPGVVPLSLGPRLLRADTAAIAALALWQAAIGDGAESPILPAHRQKDPGI